MQKQMRLIFESTKAAQNPKSSTWTLRVPDPRADLTPGEIQAYMQKICTDWQSVMMPNANGGLPARPLRAEIITTEKTTYDVSPE